MKDNDGRTIARMTCNGANANAEQVNLGMAQVHHKFAKDNRLDVLQHEAKAANVDCGATLPLSRLEHGVNSAGKCKKVVPICGFK